jgi:hypothetical protein
MQKFISPLILFIFLTVHTAAQKPDITDRFREARIDSLLEDLFFSDDELGKLLLPQKNYQFLYARTSYDSRTFFAGREIGADQYNLTGQLFYLNTNGLFAGVSGAWYSQLDPGYRTTVLTLGFSKDLKKMNFIRYRISYDYFLYNNGNSDFDPLFTSSATTGLTLKSKSLGTRVNSTFLLGKEISTQLSWDFYAYLNLIRFSTYSKLQLKPQALLYFGTESAEFQLNEILIDPDTNTEYSVYYKDVWGLMNVQLQLPLSLSLKNFDIEAAWIYNIPQTMGNSQTYPENSFFRISIGYIFNLSVNR